MRLAAVALVGVATLAHGQNALDAVGLSSAASVFPLLTTHALIRPNRFQETELACTVDGDCTAGYVCWDRHCRLAQERTTLPSPTAQNDEALQLFVRVRAVELREELALGQGPVLAAVAGPTAGATLKLHRAELLALMGDGTALDWPGRFVDRARALARLEQCSRL